MSIDDRNSPQGNYAYAVIPEWILDADIGPVAVRLFAVLDRFVGRNETAWPSRATLARRLNVTKPTIDTAIRQLVEIGAMTVTRRRSDDGLSWDSSLYSLWPACRGGSQETLTRGVVKKSDEGSKEINTVSNPIEVTPSLLSVPTTPTTRKPYSAEFDRAWSAYPRKVNKAGAFKAFTASVRKGANPTDLIEAATNYAITRKGEPENYTMHASTFFGPHERWRESLIGATPNTERDELAERRAAAMRERTERVIADGKEAHENAAPMPDELRRLAKRKVGRS